MGGDGNRLVSVSPAVGQGCSPGREAAVSGRGWEPAREAVLSMVVPVLPGARGCGVGAGTGSGS